MPVFRVRAESKIGRGLRFFLKLDVGLTRDRKPGPAVKSKARKDGRPPASKGKRLPAEDRRAARSENRLEEADGVTYDGVTLPPPNLRPNAKRRRNDDRHYLESTRWEVDKMVENLGLSPESRVLDVGCGPGRIAIGILDRVGEIKKYCGMDVTERSIDWAQRHITSEHPNFRFVHLDARNDYYNPKGTQIGDDFVLPFAKAEFDIICLYSVFTHMLTEDVRAYLKEFRRILLPQGKVFLTANLEDGVPDVTDNPSGYKGRKSYRRPLASVRYNREFFERLIEEEGFLLDRYDPTVRKGQSCLILSKDGQ